MNMIRNGNLTTLAVLLVSIVAAPAGASAATIVATTAGFANSTPDFYHVDFTEGAPGTTILSVTWTLQGSGAFNFDGTTSFMNATSPVLDPSTLVGLTPGDITFSFIGSQPNSLTALFAPGSFGVGDSFRFGADVVGLGSKLGGVFGSGSTFAAALGSGSSAAAPFRTDTSVASFATLTVSDTISVPEPRSSALLAIGLGTVAVGLAACRRG